MFLSGAPAKVSRIFGDQSTRKPQLAGLSGVTAIPASRKASTHPPSAPRRGHEAPPSAKTTGAARTLSSPDGAVKRGAASSPKPRKRERGTKSTPSSPRRPSQARRSGVALKLFGNTHQREPINASSPSSAAQPRSLSGGKA